MRRTAAIVLGCLAASLVAAARPAGVAASVLCQVRKKALVVRDACKAREELVTPDRQVELGLGGSAGPSGPPGPSTGGLRVIDAVGREVGLLTGTNGYYGSAQIVTELTLPGRSAPEFVVANVDGNGLQKEFGCADAAQYFKTSTCQGQAYSDCNSGECSLTPGELFAQPIAYQSSTTGCFFGEPSEAELGDFFSRFKAIGFSPQEVTQRCLFNNGTLLEPPTNRCKRSLFCADCCTPAPGRLLVPVHTFDASLLGTPRFRLTR